jgi:hypothetical protein
MLVGCTVCDYTDGIKAACVEAVETGVLRDENRNDMTENTVFTTSIRILHYYAPSRASREGIIGGRF